MLAAFMIDDEDEVDRLLSSKSQNAPLGTMAARTKAAYCLGLISDVELADIDTIRTIRNTFAHQLFDCSFDNVEARKACEGLQLFTKIGRPPSEFSTRQKFTFAITTLESTLRYRASIVKRQAPAFKFTPPPASAA